MRLRHIVFVLSLLAALLPARAQHIAFSHLTTDDGLSQFSVNALYLDERGFVWIATREGLNRYNSSGMRSFKLRKDDPKSLFCNTVLRITGDGDGNLFLQCSEGVARFDIRRDEFRTLLYGSASAIYYDDGFYIARGTSIYRCDPDDGMLTPYLMLPAGASGAITCMQRDSDGTLWAGTDRSGLYGFGADGRIFHPFDDANVTSIYEDSTHRLWVGTWEAGLFLRGKSAGGGVWENWRSAPGGLASDFVRSFIEDDRGDIWIGTFLGLNRVDPATGRMTVYTADGTPGSLTHSSIWDLIKDHQGTIWAGTYFGGINYFNPEYEIYTRYRESERPGEGLSSPVVGKMIEDDAHNLWICTEGGGVNVLDRQSGRIARYRHTPGRNSLSADNVKAIRYDPERHAMWIGTHLGGLNRLDLRTGRFTHYRSVPGDPTTLSSDIVRDVVIHDRALIVATQQGVCRFDPETGQARRLFLDTEAGRRIRAVASLLIDDRGTLWIAATGEGLYAYDFASGLLTCYRHDASDPNSLSNNNINSIVQDREGNLWIATSGSGIDRFRYETQDFENFDAAHNGLASDCIYDIRDSGSGLLYVITNEGFSRFDCTTHRVDNHTRANGFPLTAINENAICHTHDGKLFLGSTQGMVSFDPNALDFEAKPYRIVPNRLIVDGIPVRVGDETGILDKSLCHSPQITIPPRYSVFTIEFATSNFLPANREELVYRLEGFSDSWTPSRGQHEITYTNLNPGLYTLVIRSARHTAGELPEARLDIRILPPFYRTGWAWMIYVLLTAAILLALVRTYRARIRLQESLRYEQQRATDIEALNQSKLRFFTNISHEIRTPLTLILGQVEMLLQVQSFTPTIYNKLLRIYKNSLQLKELIGELLDFRKQEQGHMKIRVGEQDLVAYLYENYLIFREYAAFRNIRLEFDRGVGELPVWFDRQQMQKVVNNLLSNAFKHTPEEGAVTLWVRRDDDRALFGVTDSGTGIAPEEIGRIFDRFYQSVGDSAAAQGTGIGLALTKGIVELHHGTIRVESDPRRGTTFTVALPLGREPFAPEEIAAEAPVPATVEVPAVRPTTAESAFVREREEMDEGVYRRIHGARMLIVEDNEQLREMLVQLFEPFYCVSTAADGEQGWEIARAEEPQIILSDVVMPRLSGTELCRRIKEDINTCHIPVVLLTARTTSEHTLEGLRNGADDYIAKPFNATLLLSRCNNLVNSRIVLREKFSRQPEQSARMLATNPRDQQLIDRATEIIERHLDDPEFNVGIFSREIGMARTNLFAKLKAITGSTPNEFISTIRLKAAAAMLVGNPELNVSEIADRTGFSSAHYFSKCFKAQFGMSPLSYRKGIAADPPAPGSSGVESDASTETEA